MVYAVLTAQLLFLFFTSRLLFKGLFIGFYQIFHSKKISLYIVMLIFFPGTLIHELAHFLMASVLFLRTGHISLWPEITDDGYVRLGSVQVQQSDIIRRFLVGVAPVLLGSFLIALIGYYLFGVIQNGVEWSGFSILLYGVAVYGIFVISNTMFSSKKDMEGALELLLMVLVISAVLLIAGQSKIFIYLGELLMKDQMAALVQYMSYLLIPSVVLNFILLLPYILKNKKRF